MSEAVKNYSLDEKEEIINSCMPYIKYTASRLSWRLPTCLTEDDLISAGIIGLLDALERYDPALSKLNTFVEHRIKGAMLDLIEKNQFLPKQVNKKIYDLKKVIEGLELELQRQPEGEEIAERCGITLEEYYEIANDINKMKCLSFETVDNDNESVCILDFIADGEDNRPDKIVEKKQIVELVANAIQKLTEKEKLVLNLYYYEELTMKEIAKVLGITEGRVCQIHNQAIMKLKVKLLEREELN